MTIGSPTGRFLAISARLQQPYKGILMFDFAECLTRSARLVVPRIAERGLAFTFDVDVPSLPVKGDVDIAERSLHRLLQGALGLIDAGLLAILGSVSDTGLPTVRITGAGALLCGQRLVAALENLGLSPSGLSKGVGADPILTHRGCGGFLGLVMQRAREAFGARWGCGSPVNS